MSVVCFLRFIYIYMWIFYKVSFFYSIIMFLVKQSGGKSSKKNIFAEIYIVKFKLFLYLKFRTSVRTTEKKIKISR